MIEKNMYNSQIKQNFCGFSMHLIFFLLGYLFAYTVFALKNKNFKQFFVKDNINPSVAKSFANKPDFVPAVVIGGGSAGMTAGIYLCQSGYATTLISGPQMGGAITKSASVRNWPGRVDIPGFNIAKDFKDQALKNGVNILQEEVTEVDFSTWPYKIHSRNLSSGETRTIYTLVCIIATGSKPRYLKVPGEQEYWGNGVTNCAICDAFLVKNENAIIIGGGDTALTEACLLARYAKNVKVLVRGDRLKAKSSVKALVEKLKNVEIVYNTTVKEIIGKNNRVSGVVVVSNNQEETLQTSGVFLAIGSDVNTGLFKNKIELDENNFIKLYDRQETSVPGVFAAGDIVSNGSFRQAIIAAGQGCVAALQSIAFLENKGIHSTFLLKPEDLPNNSTSNDDFDEELELEQPKKSKKKNLNNESKKSNSTLIDIETEEELQAYLEPSNKNLIIDCYTTWCSSCKVLSSSLQEIAQNSLKNSTIILKVNIEKLPNFGRMYQIRSVPTLLLFDKKRALLKQLVGVVDPSDLKKIFEATFS